MIDEKDINLKDLKAACTALNGDTELLAKVEGTKIKLVAVKKAKIVNDFVALMDALCGADLDSEVPGIAVDLFNSLFADEADEADGTEVDEEGDPEVVKEDKHVEVDAAKPKAKKGTVKKDTPKSKPKAEKKAKAEKVRSRYGHIAGAKSGALDDILYNDGKGISFAAAMKAADIGLSRIKSHLKALKDKGLTVTVNEDTEDSKKSIIMVKESSI